MDGRTFRMLKFRTMRTDAEHAGAQMASKDDPRRTAIGAFLRKTSLDELPQLFNVLKGEMSLVGPRPTSFGPETYQEWQKARLAVPPGLTGLWQIAGRCEIEFDERVRLDLAYIDDWSLWLDFKLLIQTLPAEVHEPPPPAK